jgi:hypothetical protein
VASSQVSFDETAQIRGEQRRAELTGIEFADSAGHLCDSITTGQPFTCRVDYRVNRPIAGASIAVHFIAPSGEIATQFTTAVNGETFDMAPGLGTVEFYCEHMGLQPEAYRIDIDIEQPSTKENFEWQRGCTSILVESEKELRGAFHMPHTWRRLGSQP